MIKNLAGVRKGLASVIAGTREESARRWFCIKVEAYEAEWNYRVQRYKRKEIGCILEWHPVSIQPGMTLEDERPARRRCRDADGHPDEASTRRMDQYQELRTYRHRRVAVSVCNRKGSAIKCGIQKRMEKKQMAGSWRHAGANEKASRGPWRPDGSASGVDRLVGSRLRGREVERNRRQH